MSMEHVVMASLTGILLLAVAVSMCAIACAAAVAICEQVSQVCHSRIGLGTSDLVWCARVGTALLTDH